MTITPLATPTRAALPHPRTVTHLPTVDLQRRPAGAHALPEADLPDPDAYWDAETEAQFSGAIWRPTAQHGRRCACCRTQLERDEAAS